MDEEEEDEDMDEEEEDKEGCKIKRGKKFSNINA